MNARKRFVPRGGWTLIELLVMVSVLLALMAMAIAVWGMILNRTKIKATETLVRSVATAITSYSTKLWSWQDGAPGTPGALTQSGQLFDLNHDGLIDGAPAVIASATTDGGFTPALIASGYTGFVRMTGQTVTPRTVGKNLQPLDTWQHPLHIAFAAGIYGTAGFGVWSVGPDGRDETEDDLRSW